MCGLMTDRSRWQAVTGVNMESHESSDSKNDILE